MQLQLTVHVHGNMVYRFLATAPLAKEAHQQIMDELPTALSYVHSTYSILRNYQITIKEMPTEEEEKARWMEIPR